jgi:hypothetical protein
LDLLNKAISKLEDTLNKISEVQSLIWPMIINCIYPP